MTGYLYDLIRNDFALRRTGMFPELVQASRSGRSHDTSGQAIEHEPVNGDGNETVDCV